MKRIQSRAAAIAASLLAGQAAAQHEGDVLLLVEQGQITTNAFVGGVATPECSFLTTLETGDQTNDPGFDSPAGAFPTGSSVGFTLTRALRVWRDGTFDTIPEERVEVSWGPLGPVSTPAGDTPVDGFTLGVSSSGEFHYHYKLALRGPNAPGVYLLTMTMWSTSGSVAESEPISLLLNNDMDQETVDQAAEWWRDNGAWCTAGSCVADFNGDGVVNTQDFIAYLNAWTARDPRADVNGDGIVNTQDFIAYLNLWTAGC
ncbi:MAG: hypothetical protein K8E66_04575 [Phycisphaerales bacterium]|nr:hypothetical protein [Phycisphaerales bacterium]